ncbi:MAG: hypothetical protein HQL30_07030 [Candidatus Omnitrophica bacterium]|nr:hypothetical protein [Candidatus Omnitrophota bacterium]
MEKKTRQFLYRARFYYWPKFVERYLLWGILLIAIITAFSEHYLKKNAPMLFMALLSFTLLFMGSTSIRTGKLPNTRGAEYSSDLAKASGWIMVAIAAMTLLACSIDLISLLFAVAERVNLSRRTGRW